jgi:hypothetical protein
MEIPATFPLNVSGLVLLIFAAMGLPSVTDRRPKAPVPGVTPLLQNASEKFSAPPAFTHSFQCRVAAEADAVGMITNANDAARSEAAPNTILGIKPYLRDMISNTPCLGDDVF